MSANPGGRPAATLDDYVDEIAVERILSGDPPAHVRRVEMWAAIDVLDGRGLSAREISVRLRCSTRTVVRRRTMRWQGFLVSGSPNVPIPYWPTPSEGDAPQNGTTPPAETEGVVCRFPNRQAGG